MKTAFWFLVLTLRAARATPALTTCSRCLVQHLALDLWRSEVNRNIRKLVICAFF